MQFILIVKILHSASLFNLGSDCRYDYLYYVAIVHSTYWLELYLILISADCYMHAHVFRS